MVGSEVLVYRIMAAHRDELLAEGRRRRLLSEARRVAASTRTDDSRHRPTLLRGAAARLGSSLEGLGASLETLGRRLQRA